MPFVCALCRRRKASRARRVPGPTMVVTLPGTTTGARSLSSARTASSKHADDTFHTVQSAEPFFSVDDRNMCETRSAGRLQTFAKTSAAIWQIL